MVAPGRSESLRPGAFRGERMMHNLQTALVLVTIQAEVARMDSSVFSTPTWFRVVLQKIRESNRRGLIFPVQLRPPLQTGWRREPPDREYPPFPRFSLAL